MGVNLDQHAHVAGLLGCEALRCQRQFDLGRADAPGQTRERTMGGGMRIAADDGHARQRGTLLGPDDMHDALALVGNIKVRDALLARIRIQGFHLQTGNRVGDAGAAIGGGHVVIDHGQISRNPPGLASGELEPVEGLRAGHFMEQVAVDVDETGAVFFLMDDVGVPELVVERSGVHGIHSIASNRIH